MINRNKVLTFIVVTIVIPQVTPSILRLLPALIRARAIDFIGVPLVVLPIIGFVVALVCFERWRKGWVAGMRADGRLPPTAPKQRRSIMGWMLLAESHGRRGGL
jgi:phosphate/sulfate permease